MLDYQDFHSSRHKDIGLPFIDISVLMSEKYHYGRAGSITVCDSSKDTYTCIYNDIILEITIILPN